MPLDVYINRLDVLTKAKPLTPSAFAPFGEVIQNPYPNGKSGSSRWSLRKDKNLPPYARDSVPANQGTATKYQHVSRPRNLYAQAPSRRPAELVVNMFVCSSRKLSDRRFPCDDSSGSPSNSSPSQGDPEDVVSRRGNLRSGDDGSQGGATPAKSGTTEDPTAHVDPRSSDGQGPGDAANKQSEPEDQDRPVVAASASASAPAPESSNPPPPSPPEPLLPSSYFFPVNILERHPFTTQSFIPLVPSSAQYLVVVCPSLPPSRQDQNLPVPYVGADLPGSGLPHLSRIEAFVAHAGQAVTYGAGTWHAPMVALGAAREGKEGEGTATVDFVTLQFANEVGEEDCQEVVFSSADEGKFGVSVEVPSGLLFPTGTVPRAKL